MLGAKHSYEPPIRICSGIAHPLFWHGSPVLCLLPLQVSVMEDEGTLADHLSGVSATDGQWHHVAVTWESRTGTTILYLDSREVWRVTRGKGKRIPSGGTLVVGREQVSVMHICCCLGLRHGLALRFVSCIGCSLPHAQSLRRSLYWCWLC